MTPMQSGYAGKTIKENGSASRYWEDYGMTAIRPQRLAAAGPGARQSPVTVLMFPVVAK